MLTARQQRILSKVVEEYLHTGQPVSSRAIAADPALDCGPSTVRNELAFLEEHGLLDHPHISAGRVPTDAGHRYVVDELLSSEQRAARGAADGCELALVRREVDEAMRATTETLSQMTNLLAVVSAPSINTATIRHVEVLELQPRVVLIVVISSAGNVSKMLATFERDVDPGLVAWAGEYLNERLVGLGLGARMLLARLADPSLSATELDFLSRFAPGLRRARRGGRGRDLPRGHRAPVRGRPDRRRGPRQRADRPARASRRAAAGAPRGARRARRLRAHRPRERAAGDALARRGRERGYGPPRRKLGTVSVIGPVRMDYAGAIASVREAAHELSRFVEDAFAEN